MTLTWELMLIPVVGALIGWVTNIVAIKMLFWPKKPLRVPFLKWEFLGLLPKRKKDLAISVGTAVERDLLPIDEVLDAIEDRGYKGDLVKLIVVHVDQRLAEVFPRFIPEHVKSVVREFIRDVVAKEATRLIQEVSDGMMDKFREEAKLGELVQAKIESLDLEELEQLILGIAHQELRHIEVLGAVLGFVIGLFQTFFLLWRFGT